MNLDYLPDDMYREIYRIVFSDTLFVIKTISKSYGIKGPHAWWHDKEDLGVNLLEVSYVLAYGGGLGSRYFYFN